VTLAEACAADPLAAIGQHDLRSSQGKARDRAADLGDPHAPALLPRLASAARDHGDRTAVRSEQGSWTYHELAAAAGQVAAAVTAAGVRPGEIVPILATRHPRLIPALLGVLSAGAVFTVIDAALPGGRIDELVALTGARVGLTVAEPAAGSCPDLRWLVVRDPSPATPWIPDESAAGGYLAFTSGTSGRPSRVRAGTAPLAHFLTWYTARFGMGQDDRFALTSGLGYDPMLRDVLTPLWVGATVHLPDGATVKAPRALLAWLAAEQITVLHLTPQLARLLTLAAGRLRLPHLRLVCCGGDELSASDVAGMRAWASDAVIVNAYGTTETPQIVALHVVDPALAAVGPLPIGQAAPGAELLIRNPAGQPAAVGEAGRLLVRGPYLADAVLDGDGLEAEALPGHRRFDTGDLARHLADGTVQLLGRADDRVKVAGHRVDPRETDRLLLAHPAVTDAATLAVRGPDGEHRLHSYVVGADAVGADALRVYLRRALPDQLIPASVTFLESIPLNGNGKVDRAARPGAMPVTELERRIAAAWEHVQEAPVTGMDRNFFDLGGSSLTLIRLQIELERSLDRPVPIVDLFAHPTVRALAAHLGRANRPEPGTEVRSTARPHLRTMREWRLTARNATRLPEQGERNG
jgi:amino acid adenylation domain-containing protein